MSLFECLFDIVLSAILLYIDCSHDFVSTAIVLSPSLDGGRYIFPSVGLYVVLVTVNSIFLDFSVIVVANTELLLELLSRRKRSFASRDLWVSKLRVVAVLDDLLCNVFESFLHRDGGCIMLARGTINYWANGAFISI